jgi:hypothetical protein
MPKLNLVRTGQQEPEHLRLAAKEKTDLLERQKRNPEQDLW